MLVLFKKIISAEIGVDNYCRNRSWDSEFCSLASYRYYFTFGRHIQANHVHIHGLAVRSYLIGGGKGKGKSSSYLPPAFVKSTFLACARSGIICGTASKTAWNYLKFETTEASLCFPAKLMGRGPDTVVTSNIVFHNRWHTHTSWELTISFIYCTLSWPCHSWHDEFESSLWLEKWVSSKLRDV